MATLAAAATSGRGGRGGGGGGREQDSGDRNAKKNAKRCRANENENEEGTARYFKLSDGLKEAMGGRRLCQERELTRSVLLSYLQSKGEVT